MPKHDPGWNDPPTFSYNGSVTATKRTLLNRRVAFPVSSMESYSHSANSPISITPFSASINSPVFFSSNVHTSPTNEINYVKDDLIFTQSPTIDSNCAYSIDKTDEEMLLHILSIFNGVISKIPPDSECTFQKKIEDIKNRLKIFEEMWIKSLSFSVKQKMFKLAEELSAGRHNEAHALHCNLIVDHVSEVSQWMVAVKHIVFISKTLYESLGQM